MRGPEVVTDISHVASPPPQRQKNSPVDYCACDSVARFSSVSPIYRFLFFVCWSWSASARWNGFIRHR
ncbi:hypothetical protein HYQ46_003471 [Verticillium longisporum]|nr:hypothetical protein HYQ46_003471 [Verticillium longisporum]